MPKRASHILAFVFVSLASVYLGFFAFTPETCKTLFRAFGYWNIAILFTAFVSALSIARWKRTKSQIGSRKTLVFAGCAILLSLFLYTREGGGFKIVFDEHLLANVARSLYYDQDPVIRESSLQNISWYEMVGKRPLLFPFLLSLAHHLTGYQVENAFYLNFFLTAIFLGLLYTLVRRISDRRAAAYSVAMACFMPLIAQNSSGGGFEILNLCGLLICTWLAIEYWRSPDEKTLTSLILGAALFSHVRYESAIVVIPVAALILASWLRDKKVTLPYSAFLAPLTFIPLAWQFSFVKAEPGFHQYSLPGESIFSLSYIPANLERAKNFLFVPSLDYAGSPLIGMAGIAGAIAALSFSLTRRKALYANRPDRLAAAVMSLCPAAQTALVLCFTYGQLDDILVSRLGLPLVLICLICGGLLIGKIHAIHRYGKIAAIAILVLTALWAFRSYAHALYSNENKLMRRIDFAIDFAHSLPKGNYLFISNMSQAFETEGLNNMNSRVAKLRLANIEKHMQLMTYKDVYVIQFGTIDWNEEGSEKRILANWHLGPNAVLETVAETSSFAHSFTRISRIEDIDLDPPANRMEQEATWGNPNDATNLERSINAAEYNAWRESLP